MNAPDIQQAHATIVMRQAVESMNWLNSSLQAARKGDTAMAHSQPLIAAHALVQVLERIADGNERIAAALEDIAEGVDCLAARSDENGGA